MLFPEYTASPDMTFRNESNKFYGSPALGGPTPTPRIFTPSSLSHSRNVLYALVNDTAKDTPLESGHIRMFLTPSCPAFGRYTNGIDIDVSKSQMATEDIDMLRKEFSDIYTDLAMRRRKFEREYNQRNFKICSSSFFNSTMSEEIVSGNYLNAEEESSECLDMSISNDNSTTTVNTERAMNVLTVQSPSNEMSPVLLVAPMRQGHLSASSSNSHLTSNLSMSHSQPELPMPSAQPIKNQLRMSQASLMSFDAPIADSSYEVDNNTNGNRSITEISKQLPYKPIILDDSNTCGGSISIEYDDCDDDDDDDEDSTDRDEYNYDDDNSGSDGDENLFGEDNCIVYDEDYLESSDADDGDFQTRWKHALDEVRSLKCHENDDAWSHRYDNLARVTSDFADTARLYAHVIITEMGMRNKADRTIPLMYMGGVAGGDKYMVIKQIMFKCPKTKSNKDDFGFKNYDEAAKVAGHDLKGASHFLSKCLSQPDNIKITPPLMVTVEYIGIKLLAMTCLPIKGAETLVHGTPDRAKTVAKCNEEITNKLGFLTKTLNLKSHKIAGLGNFISPFDMEVHNVNGDLYAVDFSRLFPPEYTDYKGANLLYRLLRPELVIANKVPLSNDGLSAFSPSSDDDEIKEATELLNGSSDDILPYKFARELLTLDSNIYESELIFRLHQFGVNVRYLGLVYERLVESNPRSEWCHIVAIEIIVRSFRKVLNEIFRDQCIKRNKIHSNRIKNVLVINLNRFLGNRRDDKRMKMEWQRMSLWDVIRRDIARRFVWKKSTAPFFTRDNLLSTKHRIQLTLTLLSDFLGFTMYNDAWATLLELKTYESANPFHPGFVKAIFPRVKQMNISHHAKAVKLRNYIHNTDKKRVLPRYIINGCIENFRLALAREPSSVNTLRKYGQSLEEVWLAISKDPKKAATAAAYDKKIEWVFRKALDRDPNDSYSNFSLAVFYDMRGSTKQALEYYERALQATKTVIPSRNAYKLTMMGDCLLFSRGKSYSEGCSEKIVKEVEKMYKQSIEVIPNNTIALNNLAILLCWQGRLKEAGLVLCDALRKCKRDFWRLGPNCEAFCKFVLGDNDLAVKIKIEAEKQGAQVEISTQR